MEGEQRLEGMTKFEPDLDSSTAISSTSLPGRQDDHYFFDGNGGLCLTACQRLSFHC